MTETFHRYKGKAWDTHFLPSLSRLQVQQLMKEDALVVLPIGATEQHGPHLPVFTDTLIGEGLITEAFEQLPEDANIWLLAPLPYGKSTEHKEHPGTITLSAETLMNVVMDISASLSRAGFRKLLLFNTHGGNVDLLNMMGREIRIACGLDVFRLDGGGLSMGDDLIDDLEKRVGIHGGDLETSLVMAIKRSWVDMDQAPREIPNFPEGKYLNFKNKPIAWVMSDISSTGIVGNASAATEEKGRKMLKLGGAVLAQTFQEIAAFDMGSIRSKE